MNSTRLLGIMIAGVVYAFSAFAAGPMITNDDLERKYPREPPAENEAYLRDQERLRREAECAELKQLEALARKAVYDESDSRPKHERHAQLARYQSAYQKKCQSQQ